MKAVRVAPDGSIRLPKDMRRVFPKASELALWQEGDTIVLKRLKPLRPSEIAQRAPGREIPLSQIVAEVHRARRERRRPRG
jgi:hypothetical protein